MPPSLLPPSAAPRHTSAHLLYNSIPHVLLHFPTSPALPKAGLPELTFVLAPGQGIQKAHLSYDSPPSFPKLAPPNITSFSPCPFLQGAWHGFGAPQHSRPCSCGGGPVQHIQSWSRHCASLHKQAAALHAWTSRAAQLQPHRAGHRADAHLTYSTPFLSSCGQGR